MISYESKLQKKNNNSLLPLNNNILINNNNDIESVNNNRKRLKYNNYINGVNVNNDFEIFNIISEELLNDSNK